MAEEIGALRAVLSANSAQFASDMGKAREAVRSNATGMERAMNKVRDSFQGAMMGVKVMAAAAVAGGVALAAMVKGSIDAADAAQKQAQAVGTNVETLTALRHAANLSGVSQEALATALKKSAKNAADAAAGTGEAKDAYALLGITVKNTDGSLKSSDLIMKEVADRFVGMEDGAGKTALAMKMFGKSGADLIPMLNQGGAGIQAMMEEARALGLVMDTETAQAAERFNDNLTRLQGVKTGLVNQITRAVIPTLERFTDRLVTSAKETDGMGKAAAAANAGLKLLLTGGSLIVAVFDAVGTTIGGVGAALWAFVTGNFREAWNIAKNTVVDIGGSMRRTAGDVVAIWDETGNKVKASAPATGDKIAAPLVDAAGKMKKVAKEIKSDLEKTKESIDKQIATLADQVILFGKSEKAVALYRLQIQGASADQLAFASAILDAIEDQKEQQKNAEIMGEEAESWQAIQKVIADLEFSVLDEATQSVVTLNRRFDEFVAKIEQLRILGEISPEKADSLVGAGFEKTVADMEELNKKSADLDAQRASATLQAYGGMFGALSDLTGKFAGEQSVAYKGMFAISKAFALADSIVKIQQGIANAASLKWPANLAAMASVAAATAGIISTISSTSFEGGGFTGYGARAGGVDGKGGFPAILHPNETVVDHTKGGSGGSDVNLRIINVVDPKIVEAWASSASGERVIMNIVSRNQAILT